MFGRIFAKFFWDAYDYLGRLILANILFSLILLGFTAALTALLYPLYAALNKPTLILALGTGLLTILAIPFPAAGFCHFLSLITEEKEPEFRDFIKGIKLLYWPLVKMTGVFVLLLELLGLNIFFYLGAREIPPSLKIVSAVISGICVWIVLYLFAMMLYAYPLTVHQKVGMKKILIRSFILVLDNIGVTILTLIVFLGLVGMGLVTKGAAFFILNLALVASLSNSLYVNVMEKYELREAKKKAQTDSSAPPASWKDIKPREFIEDRHKRYRRTLKDILKPWEY
jgi:uncharacterized membrane protein YesL